MVAEALAALTGQEDTNAALETLFPERRSRRYGVKVNCVNPRLPTHPAVVSALIRLMVDSGIPAANILVFDRSDHELESCGFAVHRGTGVQVAGTTHDRMGYVDPAFPLTHGSVRLSGALDSIDTLINLPVLKNHEMTGVTLALKNHFGSIDRPELLHAPDRSCCPGIAEVNALAAIRESTRLVLLDALFGTSTSGLAGAPDFAPMTLVAAVDPVAADRVGLELINQHRALTGHGLLLARHIGEAARAGLGQDDLSAIDRIAVELSPVHEKPRSKRGCAANAPVILTTAAAALLARRLHGRLEVGPHSQTPQSGRRE
jgi:uncharacterized protein (DUF362 family)